MIKTKLFIIFCWFQNLAHADNAMVSDGKGFDRLFKCLCNNNDATIKDVSEHCTAEKGRNGYCLCNFTEKESKESILKDCLSSKKTFCSGYKIINQRGHCNKKLCMDALKCKDSENADISSNIDHTTYDGKENDRRDDRKGRRDRKDRKDDRKKHSRNSHITTYSDQTALNGNENKNDRWNRRKNRWDRKDDRKEQVFKVGAIVGISVGVTCTIILSLVILAIIYVCRRRSKKKKRKQLTRLQAIDQRFEMAHLESCPSSSNKERYNIPSTNKPLNTDEAQGEYWVLDPSIAKYDKDLSNRKLPEIKRCSGAEGDENVYYEIDEDKIKSSTDMEDVHQKKIEVMDKGSHNSDLTINRTQLGSMKKNTEQLTRQQSDDQGYEMSNFISSHSSTNQGGNTILSTNDFLKIDETQGEYFVLDPSVTKYDKDLVLPEVKRTSAAKGDETVYNEIDEDQIESSTGIKVDQQQQMEEARDIAIYHADLTNNQNQ
ncbi:unnamed protein product [Mytilus coruscus]|uniref:Uncharacterized protein n=1 Tax=Mytilus coruscus TaxID=42192 RepID=A0A6J8AL73_MYTCO|nr:unnamed protein product [Mytilus coruscus]